MTLIDKAEALAAILNTPGRFAGCTEAQVRKMVAEWIAALPAAVPVVTWHPFDTAPRDGSRFLAQGGGLDAVDICSYNARVGCWDCGAVTLDDTDHEPEGYNRPAQWMPLTALAPSPARDVREAALREAAAEIKRWWDHARDYREPDELILALIGEPRT